MHKVVYSHLFLYELTTPPNANVWIMYEVGLFVVVDALVAVIAVVVVVNVVVVILTKWNC